MWLSRRNTLIAGVGVVVLIFSAFAGDGLWRGYFAPDEMMNIYASWSPPLGRVLVSDRPLGLLVYRVLFGLFGLDPFPYRVVCFVLLLANLVLLYIFCKRLAASAEVAALACLLGAYHAHLADFYYASAASFDLLCFSFFYSALIIYITIRLNGQSPDARQSIVILVLYVCGLESKEMAVSLPVMMVMFEIIYMGWQGRGIGLGLLRRSGLWRLHAATISLTLLYIAGKLAGSHKMTANPGYLPRVSVQVLCDSWAHYLYDLFYQTIRFNRVSVIVLFGGTLALAILSRRREMRLAWCVTTICAVPFLFINPRGFFVMYVTLPGWYLYAGSVLVWIREAAGNRLARIGGAARGWGVSGAWVLFMLVAAIIVPFHGLEKSVGNTWIDGAFDQTRPVLEELASRYPIMPQGAKLLFVSDPFERDDYILYFICVLRYRDRDIRVDRVKVTPGLATEAAWREYDHVFMLSSKGLVEVDRRLELSN